MSTSFEDVFEQFVSFELFNREYRKQGPNEVAKTGLTKMRAVPGGAG